MVDILFYLLGFVLLSSAIAVISSKNTTYSVFFLILCLFNTAGLFILLEAEFLAMLLIIVYVGAVAVLFLFVIMMLNFDYTKLHKSLDKYLPIGIMVSGIFLVEMIAVIYYATHRYSFACNIKNVTYGLPPLKTNANAIGSILYTDFVFPFQLSGVILLIAMIGAIVLTFVPAKPNKKTSPFKQVKRTKADSVELVKVEFNKGVNI